MPVALAVVLLALYYLYHLKNHAKYYRYLNRECFKILTIWREAYTKIRKPFKEKGRLSKHTSYYSPLNSQSKHDCLLLNPGSLYAPGFVRFPSV